MCAYIRKSTKTQVVKDVSWLFARKSDSKSYQTKPYAQRITEKHVSYNNESRVESVKTITKVRVI